MKKCVGVKIKSYDKYSDKEYSFFTDFDLRVDDLVVCDTKLGKCIGKVVNLSGEKFRANRWIVSRIDEEEFECRINTLNTAEDILGQMQEQVAYLNWIKQMEMYAKEDPLMRDLFNQYKRVTGRI